MNGFQLNKSTPEKQGVKSEAILRMLNEFEKKRTEDMDQDIHSIIWYLKSCLGRMPEGV